MQKTSTVLRAVVVMSLMLATPAFAQSGNSDKTRDDKDNSHTKVADVEGRLRDRLKEIRSTVPGLKGRKKDRGETHSSLKSRVAANEAAIAALTATINDLKTQLSAVQAALGATAGDVTSLQAQVDGLVTTIGAYGSQIASLQQQNAQLAQFQANLQTGACDAGQAVTAIAPNGFIVCSPVGGGGVTLQTYVATAAFDLAFGSNSLSVSCQPGYHAVGSGYQAPAYYESVVYVDHVEVLATHTDYPGVYVLSVPYNPNYNPNTWWLYAFPVGQPFKNISTAVFPTSSTIPVGATQVTGSWTDATTAYADVQFIPRTFFPATATVQVTCARVQ